jgi:hypothetical protein
MKENLEKNVEEMNSKSRENLEMQARYKMMKEKYDKMSSNE